MQIRQAAHFLSYFFHPLLIPTYGTATFVYLHLLFPATEHHFSLGLKLIFLIFLFTFALPVLSSLWFMRIGLIKNLELESSEERRIPFLTTGIIYSISYYFIGKMHLSQSFETFILGGTVAIVLGIIINYRWKISMHMMGMGVYTGLLMGLSEIFVLRIYWLLTLAIILSGLVAASRLFLGAHSDRQVYLGYLLGMFAVYVFYLL